MTLRWWYEAQDGSKREVTDDPDFWAWVEIPFAKLGVTIPKEKVDPFQRGAKDSKRRTRNDR